MLVAFFVIFAVTITFANGFYRSDCAAQGLAYVPSEEQCDSIAIGKARHTCIRQLAVSIHCFLCSALKCGSSYGIHYLGNMGCVPAFWDCATFDV